MPPPLLFAETSYHTSSLMTRAEYLKSMPKEFEPVRGVGDYPTRLYLCSLGEVFCLPDVMSVYRYRTPGSWSARTSASPQEVVETAEAISDMLRRVDGATRGRFHAECEDALRAQEYKVLLQNRDFRAMAGKRYKDVRRGFPFRHRAMVAVGVVAPWALRLFGK